MKALMFNLVVLMLLSVFTFPFLLCCVAKIFLRQYIIRKSNSPKAAAGVKWRLDSFS